MTSKPKTTKTTEKKNANPDNSPGGRKASRKRAGRRRRPPRQFSAEQKAQAVLATWTERLNQSEVCRQLEINYATFQLWQKRAMEGMLQALEDHARLADGAALSPRLRKLIESGRGEKGPNLEERLKQVQLAPQEGRAKNPSV